MSGARDAVRAFFKRRNETLDVETIPVPLRGLAEPLSGMRAAVVADLHIERLTPYHERILAALYAARPHLILVAGDTIDEKSVDIERLESLFTHIARIAPAFAILGNNDCGKGQVEELFAMYKQSGVRLLDNEKVALSIGGRMLWVAGVSDRAAKGAFPNDALPAPTVALIHRPETAKDIAALGPSLIVAGHAHGGQFRLPGIGGLYAPGQGVFPRLTSGLYRVGGVPLVVSRGLGNHGFPVRLGNLPHIPIVEFQREG